MLISMSLNEFGSGATVGFSFYLPIYFPVLLFYSLTSLIYFFDPISLFMALELAIFDALFVDI